MPNTIRYQSLSRVLSSPRLETYRQVFQDHDDKEVYGVYLWNKALCGAIYPILQAVEIALRNTIDSAAREIHGDYWHEKIHHFQVRNDAGDLVNDENYKKFRAAFKTARGTVIKELKKTQVVPEGFKPDFNKVVSETSFVTWEYVLHPCFFKVGDPMFLWPKATRKAFRNWPEQSAKKTHIRLYDLVSEIRPFRNRLSHHEPLWKGVNVTTEAEAISFVLKKVSSVEELLWIICDEKVKLLELHNLISKAKGICSQEALDRYRYRSKNINLSLKHKRKIKQFLFEAHDNDQATLFNYGGRLFSIERG